VVGEVGGARSTSGAKGGGGAGRRGKGRGKGKGAGEEVGFGDEALELEVVGEQVRGVLVLFVGTVDVAGVALFLVLFAVGGAGGIFVKGGGWTFGLHREKC